MRKKEKKIKNKTKLKHDRAESKLNKVDWRRTEKKEMKRRDREAVKYLGVFCLLRMDVFCFIKTLRLDVYGY